MKQLTVKVLKERLASMPDNAVVYLGDDEELNGVHGAYFVQTEPRKVINSISYGTYNKGGVLIS